MKKLFAILIALIVCGTEGVFAQPRLGPLCGYTPPRSEFRDLKLSANYRYYNDQFADNRDNVNSGSVRASFSRVLDAPTFGLSQQATLKLDLTKDAFTYQADGTLNLRAYIAQTNFFGFIGAETQGATTFVSPGLRVSAGLGYGRFKDVTALSKALKIQERLLGLKAISAPLPATVIFELADTIGRRAEFPDLASLVQRLEEIIEATGFVPHGQLGAVALLRIEEIINETADEKLCGWELRLGLGYELLAPQGETRDWLTLASFEYALAPAPRSQFKSSLRFGSSLGLLEDYVLIAQAHYSFRITETIDAQATYNFVRTQFKARSPLDIQSIDLRLTFQVQANLNLAVQLEFTLASDFEEWTQGLTITANYDLF
ncbi:MAG: hypothetical protein NZ930_07250 [Candidatus Bipolaricaulota bacterium]|nr:hypothetical protein [Candidatus Bipolaricaulota bacterium]MDW8031836.1 hypothetical protein [Candidatus Bipolaricaulota bacterium]